MLKHGFSILQMKKKILFWQVPWVLVNIFVQRQMLFSFASNLNYNQKKYPLLLIQSLSFSVTLLNTHTHAYTHIRTHAHTHTRTHTYKHTHSYTHSHTHIHAHSDTHEHIHTHTRICRLRDTHAHHWHKHTNTQETPTFIEYTIGKYL